MIKFIKNLFRKRNQKKRSLNDYEFNELKQKRQEKTDDILEKISKNGIDSLNKSERDFLDSLR